MFACINPDLCLSRYAVSAKEYLSWLFVLSLCLPHWQNRVSNHSAVNVCNCVQCVWQSVCECTAHSRVSKNSSHAFCLSPYPPAHGLWVTHTHIRSQTGTQYLWIEVLDDWCLAQVITCIRPLQKHTHILVFYLVVGDFPLSFFYHELMIFSIPLDINLTPAFLHFH